MNQSIQLKSLVATTIASAILFPASEALAVSRYLPDPADPSFPIFKYGNMMPTQFDRDVNSSIGKCGEIRFDYDTYSRVPDGTLSGGAVLAGGFFIDRTRCMELNGFQLGWVQTVTATKTGTDAVTNWMIPPMNAGEYPDAKPTNPLYPFTTISANSPFAPPEAGLGFGDISARNFVDGPQSWLAELGLVAITNNMIPMEMDGVTMIFREVRVLSTFRWGFSFNNPKAPFGVGNVTANAPANWGAPNQSYLNTLNNFYDGMGGGDPNATPPVPGKVSTKFKFVSSNNVFKLAPQNTIPEPSSILGLLALGTLGAGSALKRKLKPSKSTEKETTKVG